MIEDKASSIAIQIVLQVVLYFFIPKINYTH